MNDTISAISTPVGEGGIGIVRMSGTDVKRIIDDIFSPAGEILTADKKLVYGKIVSAGEIIDEVLVSFHPKPNTYTREDIVEINCHGGVIPLRRILMLTLEKGARLAEPGEFTRRAFENGRIDLSQAEAVMDLVVSSTNLSAAAAVRQLRGGLKEGIERLRSRLLDILAEIEAVIDYPEEDLPAVNEDLLPEKLKVISREIINMLADGERGRLIREGAEMVIVGLPNAGKSSLLNHLLQRKKAIVSDIPGTTRDIVEEDFNLNGIPVRLADTAGIRETGDIIEMEGVKLARERAQAADLILHIIDGSKKLSKEDVTLSALPQKGLTLINKNDLPQGFSLGDAKKFFVNRPPLQISLVDGKNLELLDKMLEQQLLGSNIKETEPPLVTNIRHLECLKNANNSLSDALSALQNGMPYDIISIDIKDAWNSLGSITGLGSPTEIIDHIFRRFCLGK